MKKFDMSMNGGECLAYRFYFPPTSSTGRAVKERPITIIDTENDEDRFLFTYSDIVAAIGYSAESGHGNRVFLKLQENYPEDFLKRSLAFHDPDKPCNRLITQDFGVITIGGLKKVIAELYRRSGPFKVWFKEEVYDGFIIPLNSETQELLSDEPKQRAERTLSRRSRYSGAVASKAKSSVEYEDDSQEEIEGELVGEADGETRESACKDLVVVKDGVAMADSLGVAERFEKQHKHVLDAIRDLDCSEEFSRRNFRPRKYMNRGREYPMFEMTRDGFSFLVMGFTGKKAAQWKELYIDAFNAMEAELRKPQDSSQQSDLSTFIPQILSYIKDRDEAMMTVMGKMVEVMDKVSNRLDRLETSQPVLSNKFSILAFANMHDIKLTLREATKLGRLCTRECSKRNLMVESVPDSRHGTVHVYPLNALIRVFRTEYPSTRFGDFKDADGTDTQRNM